jgi:SAM-dependent methyltransferase
MQENALDRFVVAAQPFVHWPDTYFQTRLNEMRLLEMLFPQFYSNASMLLDVGCGLGLAAVFASSRVRKVVGIDLDEPGDAFKVSESPARVGARLLTQVGIANVSLVAGELSEQGWASTFDRVASHFVVEHVPDIVTFSRCLFEVTRPGGLHLHVIPNTHEAMTQLLVTNLDPTARNLARWGWSLLKRRFRPNARGFRHQGTLFAPPTHSEFLYDFRRQFDVYNLERTIFPLMDAGFLIRDIKPVREVAYAVLAERPIQTTP